ncbi:MAG: winged helix-turn-helix domain-containing protein, partial [Thermoplasmata archaeon]
MDNRGLIRVLGHYHRHKILRTLEKEPMPYSHLLAKVEPESKGRGRFNYHLKVLKDAGLIDIAGAQYRLTPSGAVAAQLLIQASKKVVPPPRRRTQLTIIGSLIGIGGVGLLLLLSIVLAPVVLEAPGTAQVPGWNIPTFVSDLNINLPPVGANPQVAVDRNGNAIAIWTQDDGARTSVWANRFVTGVGWSAPTLIENDDTGDAGEPMLAIDPSGNAWAVWYQIVRDPHGGPALHSIWANRFVSEVG